MIEHLHFVLPFVAALGAGLMAGIFFAFSAFVMTALGRLRSRFRMRSRLARLRRGWCLMRSTTSRLITNLAAGARSERFRIYCIR